MKLKIADVKAYPISVEVPRTFYNAIDTFTARSVTLIKVIAEDGSYGWGDAYGPAALGVGRMIETYIKDRIVGEDAMRIEYLWQKIQTKKGLPVSVLGGVDMALWDLKSKAMGVPFCELLGGRFFDELHPYGSGLTYKEEHPDSMEELEKEVADMLTYGFHSIKMKIGFGKELDQKRVCRVRELIGDSVGLMVDANQAYSVSSCLEMLPFLREMNVKWLEEPLPWHSFSSYKQLRTVAGIPIAAGEGEITTQGFVEAIQGQICDIIQPDMPAIGGITPLKRVATMAYANNIECHPHVFGTVIALPAVVQFMCGQPNYQSWCTFPDPVEIEWDTNPNSMARKLIKEPLKVENGVIKIPDRPGFGVEINEDAIEEFLVK